MFQFDDNSVVCFLGDSITANGAFIRRIYDYYRLEKNIKCKLYNCGVPGDRANKALWRLEETVFCYEPTDVVVSFGVNDCGYNIYSIKPLTDTALLERRRLLDTCINSLRQIAEKCAAKGIRVTFCSPTLTDELMKLDTPCCDGAAAALLELSLRIWALSEELGAGYVDFSFPFRDLALKLSRKDQALVRPDRVHPTEEGHELMALLFLKGQGFDVTVPDTWEALHELAQRPHDEWEDRRYQLETEANNNLYVEWGFGFGRKTPQAMENAIRYRLTEDISDYVRQKLNAYIPDRTVIDHRRQILIDFTNTV